MDRFKKWIKDVNWEIGRFVWYGPRLAWLDDIILGLERFFNRDAQNAFESLIVPAAIAFITALITVVRFA